MAEAASGSDISLQVDLIYYARAMSLETLVRLSCDPDADVAALAQTLLGRREPLRRESLR